MSRVISLLGGIGDGGGNEETVAIGEEKPITNHCFNPGNSK